MAVITVRTHPRVKGSCRVGHSTGFENPFLSSFHEIGAGRKVAFSVGGKGSGGHSLGIANYLSDRLNIPCQALHIQNNSSHTRVAYDPLAQEFIVTYVDLTGRNRVGRFSLVPHPGH